MNTTVQKKYIVKEKKDTRSGFGCALLDIARKNEKIVALCADLTSSLKMDAFAKEFPERFIQVGIAEANMIGIAAGLATCGFIPFVGSFANFLTGRVYDQIRQVVAYSWKNVKLAASHAGISLGEDGASHQIMEDIALMRALPNMVVLNPCDYNQTYNATIAASQYYGPVYIRFGRPSVPNFTNINQNFVIGKAVTFEEGTDVTIFATGHMVWKALEAWEILKEENISAEVINIHTIKPIDKDSILRSVTKTKCVVVTEEHVINGGLCDAISNILVTHYPIPAEFVAMNDCFGESGKPDELFEKYGLTSTKIAEAAIKVIKRK
ncbi:MAG: transketolase family protein [Bacteroidales bacterium]|nr:transketolase family protein [Bacteroidales bacterium]